MPVDVKLFQSGMERLARMLPDPRVEKLPEAQRRKAIEVRTADYAAAITPLLNTSQWIDAVNYCIANCRYFPVPADLLAPSKAAREARDKETAAIAWELVLGAGTYSPSGTSWNRRQLEERFGNAVGVAFEACGGSSAIRWMEDDQRDWIRKRFVDAYAEQVRLQPLAALPEAERKKALAPPARPALPPAPDAFGSPEMTPEEAKAFVRQLEAKMAAQAQPEGSNG